MDDEDRASVISNKSPPSEGLRLLFQLCPSAAQPPPQKVCKVEGLFGALVSNPVSGDVPMTLFHHVAELLSEYRLKFQVNLEAGKLPASGLPSHRREPGSCEEPMLWSAAPFDSFYFV